MYKIKDYSNFIIKDTHVGKMLLNKNDHYICRDLINKGVWENYLHNHFNNYIKKGDCVIDLGANNGSHTLLFSKLVGENGQVHSFEPREELFFQLNYNLVTNKCLNTISYKYGISDTEKTIYMPSMSIEKSKNFGAESLDTESLEKNDKNIDKIELKTLDSLNLAPSFIKIDVEGMEDKVLLGGVNTISKHKPVIIIEIHQGDLERLKKIIDDIGYKFEQKLSCWDYIIIPK